MSRVAVRHRDGVKGEATLGCAIIIVSGTVIINVCGFCVAQFNN